MRIKANNQVHFTDVQSLLANTGGYECVVSTLAKTLHNLKENKRVNSNCISSDKPYGTFAQYGFPLQKSMEKFMKRKRWDGNR